MLRLLLVLWHWSRELLWPIHPVVVEVVGPEMVLLAWEWGSASSPSSSWPHLVHGIGHSRMGMSVLIHGGTTNTTATSTTEMVWLLLLVGHVEGGTHHRWPRAVTVEGRSAKVALLHVGMEVWSHAHGSTWS